MIRLDELRARICSSAGYSFLVSRRTREALRIWTKYLTFCTHHGAKRRIITPVVTCVLRPSLTRQTTRPTQTDNASSSTKTALNSKQRLDVFFFCLFKAELASTTENVQVVHNRMDHLRQQERVR